jgi:NAD(P)-dependent dehydrogenase (short-subunit alcohol dehydrogenase family)
VNNAGICGSQLFEDATLDDFDHYWRVHLGGPVNTVKAAWPYMVAQRSGKIILTTSVSGLFGLRGQATDEALELLEQLQAALNDVRRLRARSS